MRPSEGIVEGPETISSSRQAKIRSLSLCFLPSYCSRIIVFPAHWPMDMISLRTSLLPTSTSSLQTPTSIIRYPKSVVSLQADGFVVGAIAVSPFELNRAQVSHQNSPGVRPQDLKASLRSTPTRHACVQPPPDAFRTISLTDFSALGQFYLPTPLNVVSETAS